MPTKTIHKTEAHITPVQYPLPEQTNIDKPKPTKINSRASTDFNCQVPQASVFYTGLQMGMKVNRNHVHRCRQEVAEWSLKELLQNLSSHYNVLILPSAQVTQERSRTSHFHLC